MEQILDRRYRQRPPLYRIHYIDHQIQARQYPNSKTLSDELEVSRRTILRDIEFMRDRFGAPLAFNSTKKGYYYTEAGYSLGLLKLTEGELLALYLGHSLLTRCQGTPYEQPVISAFRKLCLCLPNTVSIDFGRLADSITFDLEPLRGEAQQVAAFFTVLGQAIEQRHSVRLLHYAIARDTVRGRRVDPYHLRYHQGAWYLVGYCHLRRAVRIFALDRIRSLQPTGATFALPPGFNADDYFRDAFQFYRGSQIHRVEIWFNPREARWIKEKQWHPTQEVIENPDGSLTLAMRTSGLNQVQKWILSFGSGARALAPPALVKEIEVELKRARNNYR